IVNTRQTVNRQWLTGPRQEATMASRFWVGGTGNWDATDTSHWAASSGGSSGASVPTSSDDVTLDASSGGGTMTVASTAACLSFNAAAFTGGITLSAGFTVSGNVTLPTTAITTGGVFGITIISTCAFTSNGSTVGGSIALNTGAVVTLQDTNRVNNTMQVNAGTLNTNGQTCTWGFFSSSNSNTRTLTLGASAITVTATGTVTALSKPAPPRV